MESIFDKKSDAAQGQQALDDKREAAVADWMDNVGYRKKPRRGLNRRGDDLRRRDQAVVPKKPALVLDLSSVTVKKALKGGADKKTCVVELGRTPYVVKGGTAQSATHVEATEFLGELGLKGVRVPKSILLSDREKTAIAAALKGGSSDDQELADSLSVVDPSTKQTWGQASEVIEGVAVDDLLKSPKAAQDIANLIAMRRSMEKMPPDQAWLTALAALRKSSSNFNGTKFKDRFKAAETAATVQEQKDFTDWLAGTGYAIGNAVAPLKALVDLHGGTLKQNTQVIEKKEADRQVQARKLADWAKSPAGVEAFAGVAAGDLMTGMNDRILEAWNGGNFLYDEAAGQLCVIDNQKRPQLSLGAQAVPGEWEDWLRNMTKGKGSLEDALFATLYEAPKDETDGAPDALCNFVAFDDKEKAKAKATIREVIDGMLSTIEDDPAQGKAAKDRVKVLRLHQQLADTFKLPQSLRMPPARKTGAAAQAGKMAKSGFSRLRALADSGHQNIRTQTKAIKDGLRNGSIDAATARQQLTALQNQGGASVPDRRSDKIDFLAKGLEVAQTLDAMPGLLDQLLQDKDLPDSAKPAETLHAMAASLRESVAAWETRCADEAHILNRIQDAWGRFPAQYK